MDHTRIALISDVHANLVALEAILDDLDSLDGVQIVCLGDIAASGPQPREVVERFRSLDCKMIMGNMDEWLLEPESYQGNDEFYRIVTDINLWCAAQLHGEDFSYLGAFYQNAEIPLGISNKLLCYHGSPRSNTDFFTSSTPDEDLDVFLSGHQALVMVGGHSHVQMLRRYRSSLLINPGSVGLAFECSQSSERNVPWAEYAVLGWDGNRIAVEFRRVPYDVGMLKNAAFNSGMPHVEWFVEKWQV